ncbi:hypothetical protein GCM10009801_33880 [Streptomyces albiaxialis]|uniref:Uncharacterized protein n=1 Tax=Streptomyces albiaxialis TaxID=329523 RepID=A0ABP5HI16_9ACTN
MDDKDGPLGVAGAAAATALAAWFTVTALSQHPDRTNFDRIRHLDWIGLGIPDWRFFAPNPAQQDYRLFHRSLDADGNETAWREAMPMAPRRWTQALWFPSRRQDKGFFDLMSQTVTLMNEPRAKVADTVPYRLLAGHVEHELRAERRHSGRPLPRGFQFLVAQDGGYDDEETPSYLFTSAFIPLTP